MFAAAMSITATAQTDIWYWQDGKATKVESVDSITFAEPQAAAPVTTFNGAGSRGCYCSASLSADNAEDAYGLYFHSGGQGWDGGCRYYGQAVRPVYSSSSSVQY